MKKKFNRVSFLFLISLFWSEIAFAQFVEFTPLSNSKYKKTTTQQGFRKLETASLPFWDDFSSGLDTLVWKTSGTTYTETIGINAPSLGMILFNGVDEKGKPYSRSDKDQDMADFFSSGSFDLSSLKENEQNTVFLSFFWQAGGKAELPDETDKLQLQFLDATNQWVTVWEKSGGPDSNRAVFSQEIIQISDSFQHPDFRFRFFNQGRLSGPFDSWLIDYIYLGKNRTPEDLTYRDRSLTQPNQLRIGDFGAYPFDLLSRANPDELSAISNQFLNLQDRFRAMEYSILIRDTISGMTYPVNSDTPFNPVPNSLERRGFESRLFQEIPKVNSETTLEILTYLTTGDSHIYQVNGTDTVFYESVNYRINDTVKTYFPIRDYFSYDNGSADYAAGINQRSGQLAVKYTSPEAVFLKGITINFTNANQANQPVDILVWRNLDSKPVYRKEALIPLKTSSDELIYYSLDTNILVNGDFYIGFAQFTNDFIHVGLDKTNDQGGKIFYNVAGAWAQNNEVKGSLMIRPHVSPSPPFEEAGLPKEYLKFFPNPVESILNIEGTYREVRIFDSFGREIFPEKTRGPNGEIINFAGQKPGVYVLNLMKKSGPESIRILVK